MADELHRIGAGPWIWAFSQEFKERYWYNVETRETSWINPYQLCAKRRANSLTSALQNSAAHGDTAESIAASRKRYRAASALAAIDDHPLLSIERDKLLGDILDLLAKENSKFGEMAGETKTAKACRHSGMKVGMQGLFARIVWYELLQQILTVGDVGTMATDSIFPNTYRGDPAVLREFIDGGRTEAEGRQVMDAVGRSLTAAAKRLLDMKRDLISRPVVSPVILSQRKIQDRTVCTLEYQGVAYSISNTHLEKLLKLYQLHTDKFAHTQDSLFVSPQRHGSPLLHFSCLCVSYGPYLSVVPVLFLHLCIFLLA